MTDIRYYISGHGLGHASRSSAIIAALRSRHSRLVVDVVSSAHPWFMQANLPGDVGWRACQLDVGVVQHDSLIMRPKATVAAWRNLLAERDDLVAAEVAKLREDGVRLVVSDISPLPFAAAAAAEIPGVAVGNFTWDWILAGLAPAAADIVEQLRRDYAAASLYLRLPFAPEETPIAVVEPMPLVVRRRQLAAATVRKKLGIRPEERLALLSFGGFGLEIDSGLLHGLEDWIFLADREIATGTCHNLRDISGAGINYPDMVGAVDVVISKPGFGIVAEAIAGRKRVLYARRGDFREQPYLIDALQRYLPAVEITNTELRGGNWGAALERLIALPYPATSLATNGAETVADRLAELVI